jgi:hypothetical protein
MNKGVGARIWTVEAIPTSARGRSSRMGWMKATLGRRVWLLRRALAVALGALALFACPGAGATTATEARSVQLTITAHLKYVSSQGAFLIEEGPASGELAGTVKARLKIGAGISGSFTLDPVGGSISGSGSGTLHESGTYASFSGSLKIRGGTRRYAHARGAGRLYGVYNRKTLGVTIQAIGRLSY